MGNLYHNHEEARRKVFSTFVNNLTISFPQSIHFEDNEDGEIEKQKSQEAYRKNPNLVLVARDAQSFHRMQSTFDNPVIFTPDMVLYMNYINWKFNRNGALFVLRHDSEKVVKKTTIDNIKDILGNERPVKRVDTVLDEPQKITPVTREALFDSELELFSHQEIIMVLLQSFNTEYKSPILILWLCWYTHQNFNFSRYRKAEERSISSVLFVYASQCFYALNRS